VRDRGLDVDEFAPRFSFNVSTMRDFFEEIAKHRAIRRLWAGIMRDTFGARDPRSWTFRLFSGGDGTSLTAVEPLNNIVRTTLQTLAIVLSGAQAVHTMSWDEALALPSQEAALLALRTQQIIAYESGVTRSVDPLGGSWLLESLTNELERRASDLLEQIEEHGVVEGIADGSLERTIADTAYQQHQAIASGDWVVTGVNRFQTDEADAQEIELLSVPEAVRDRQIDRLARVRAERDAAALDAALAQVRRTAEGDENTMPAILEAVRAYATVGEISTALGEVFGYHRPSTVT
jgi:methylmalonyl-CoA mutase N-terminal domain/subunit